MARPHRARKTFAIIRVNEHLPLPNSTDHPSNPINRLAAPPNSATIGSQRTAPVNKKMPAPTAANRHFATRAFPNGIWRSGARAFQGRSDVDTNPERGSTERARCDCGSPQDCGAAPETSCKISPARRMSTASLARSASAMIPTSFLSRSMTITRRICFDSISRAATSTS
jgi:hypothetical protein